MNYMERQDGGELLVGTNEVLAQIHRLRSRTGIVAFIVSVAIHVLILWQLSTSSWSLLSRPERAPRPHKVIKLGEVKYVPAPQPVRPERFRPENPNLSAEAPGEAAKAVKAVDEAKLESRVPPGEFLAAASEPLREPEPGSARPVFQPRQEILMIDKQIVGASPYHPRVLVAATSRVNRAADLVFAADWKDATQIKDTTPGTGDGSDIDLDTVDLQKTPVFGRQTGARPPAVTVVPTAPDVTKPKPSELEARLAPYRQLEKLLKVDVWKYAPGSEPYSYCMIEIKRIGESQLPVLPKDILLVQDFSASITEQRLHFCREGMTNTLALIGPKDRFNVIGFRDRVERLFPEWKEPTPVALEQARDFIARMQSRGNTDIYGPLLDFLKEQRQKGRPMIVYVVSDGIPTVGVTDSTRIIEEFSALNKGEITVFTIGTSGAANSYLLDLLSYRNRGDTFLVTSGRWDIPTAILERMRGFSRPVLGDLKTVFTTSDRIEIYPALTSNLYLDRPLVLYCRYPRELNELAFQVSGVAGDITCDMVFKVDLNAAKSWKSEVRTLWAWQKVYHLIGEHTRTRSPTTIAELKQVGKAYALKIPYLNELIPR